MERGDLRSYFLARRLPKYVWYLRRVSDHMRADSHMLICEESLHWGLHMDANRECRYKPACAVIRFEWTAVDGDTCLFIQCNIWSKHGRTAICLG